MEKDVVPVHRNITMLIEKLTDIQSNLYLKYREYLEKNKVLQVFGLDSFHYQCRLFDLELKHAQEQYSFLNNRMYCDYYKLYHVVRLFVSETFQHEPKKRTFPVYKDLEPYKLYEMSDITLLYEDISEMIRRGMMEISKKEKEVARDAQEKGLHLEHFIHHRASNHSLLTTKIELYEKYLHAYHIYHMSFLSNLLERLKMLFRQNEPTVEAKPYPPEPMTKYLPADPKDPMIKDATIKGSDEIKETPDPVVLVDSKVKELKETEVEVKEPQEEVKEVEEVQEEVKEEPIEVEELQEEVKEPIEVEETKEVDEHQVEVKEEVKELHEEVKELQEVIETKLVNPLKKKKKRK